MPSVTIEVKREHTEAEEVAIMQAVYAAMVTAFGIAPSDSTIRLLVHAPHRYQPDPDLAQPERHTHISIRTFSGRTVEAKRVLYHAMVTNLEILGIPRNHVEIVLHEIPRENWGIRGGQAGCDIA